MYNPFLDLTKIKHVHFVGLKGVAMTSLALWFYEQGIKVTGSDVVEKFPTDDVLAKTSITLFDGFSPDHVAGDLVIYTGAHNGRNNCEVIEAVKQNIMVLPHGKALGLIMDSKYKQLSIAGCHGKTTTSAMVATILAKSDENTAYAIGSGEIRGLGLPGHYGKGEWFVAEADEYALEPGFDNSPRFLQQHPDILLITNIDYDHPDIYENLNAVKDAYSKLANQLQGNKTIILNADDVNSQSLIKEFPNAITFGFSDSAMYKIDNLITTNLNNVFTMSHLGNKVGEFNIKVPGIHNVLNAAGALLACHSAGVSFLDGSKYLATFKGVARRFEHIGSIGGVECFDDYAHHPREIEATLSGLAQWYKEKEIIAIFQAHTYTRTQALLSEFGLAFHDAFKVRILPIYASAREKNSNITGRDLVNEIAKHHKNVAYWDNYEDLRAKIIADSNNNSVIVSLGAGDIGVKIRKCID